MAKNFDGLTVQKLHEIVSSSDFINMSLSDLNALRKAAQAANILDSFDGDKISIKINNKTFNDIKNSDKYTAEEKALAKEARDEYNAEIRKKRADEILKNARKVDGQYVFESLTVGEATLLEKVGLLGRFTVNKETYQIGQVKDNELAQILQALKANAEKREAEAQSPVQDVVSVKSETAQTSPDKKKQTSAPIVINEDGSATINSKPEKQDIAPEEPTMSADLQKSYDFWNKFNENSEKTGVKFQIDNIENRHLLVEAKKGDKTLFKGIDHGSKGFDIVKRDKNADAYPMFDMLVKKVKARNPKTVIRIKDNVTDEVLRNKILIACAKNNMKPVGNLPEGFDFEELKEAVKNLKSAEEINAFAEEMIAPSEYGFGQEQEDETERKAVNALAQAPKDKKKERKIPVVPVVVNRDGEQERRAAPVAAVSGNGGNGNKDNQEERRTPVAPVIANKDNEPKRRAAPVAAVSGNGGNGNNNNQNPGVVVPTASAPKKEKWWKKAWNKSKNWILGGALVAASLFGVKSCQQSEQLDKAREDIENLQSLNQSLNEDIDDLNKALEDCGKSKQPEVKAKPVVKTPVKKRPSKKPTPVIPVVTPVVQDTVSPQPVVTPVVQDTVSPQPVVTPVVQDTVSPQPVIDKKKNHGPDGLTSVPTQDDINDAMNGVVDFGRRHVADDDLSSDPIVDAYNAATERAIRKNPAKDKNGNTVSFVDFYTALHNNNRN